MRKTENTIEDLRRRRQDFSRRDKKNNRRRKPNEGAAQRYESAYRTFDAVVVGVRIAFNA